MSFCRTPGIRRAASHFGAAVAAEHARTQQLHVTETLGVQHGRREENGGRRQRPAVAAAAAATATAAAAAAAHERRGSRAQIVGRYGAYLKNERSFGRT